MELKEIWEQGAIKYSTEKLGEYDEFYIEDFIAGCEFEHNRSHWFDPEKVLPPRNQDQDTNRSIYVLVKDWYYTISEKQYNFQGKCWEDFEGEEGKVISWAYIPK